MASSHKPLPPSPSFLSSPSLSVPHHFLSHIRLTLVPQTEFIKMMSTSVKQSDFAHETRAAFAVFDKDGSGTISADELRQVMKSLGEDLTDREIDEMIAEADKDRNGSIDCKFLSTLSLLLSTFVGRRVKLMLTGAKKKPDEEFVQLLSPKP